MTGAPNAEHEQILRVLGNFVVNSDRLSMTEERKTLEQREQMTDLERLRHSASHVLADCHSERSEAKSRMERLGKPRHGRQGRRLSERA